jgi:hypothetical protein
MVNISERVFKVDGLLKAVNDTPWFTLLLRNAGRLFG